MNRLVGALIAYAVLGILTWMTISDSRIRGATLLILGLFAVKSWLRREDVMHSGEVTEADSNKVNADAKAFELKADS